MPHSERQHTIHDLPKTMSAEFQQASSVDGNSIGSTNLYIKIFESDL